MRAFYPTTITRVFGTMTGTLSRPRATVLVLFLLWTTGISAAQSTLHGTVTDAASGTVLAAVHVYIPSLELGAVTGEDGQYELTSLPPGTFVLQYSRLGYATAVFEITLGRSSDMRLDAALSLRVIDSGEVVVLADRPRPRMQVPLPSYSFDRTERLASGSMSLWEAIDRLPGVARSSAGPGIERPFLRGLSGGRILLMLDGQPYSYQTWDPELGINTDGNDAEQVDVIQGPATLLYGPGAMGGVIVLSPEHPAPVNRTVGSYTLGLASNSEGIYNGLSVRHSTRKAFWGVRAGFDSHADYRPGENPDTEDEGSEEEVPNSRYNHLQVRAFGGLSRDWGSTRISYRMLRHRNGIIEIEDEAGTGPEEEGRDIEAPFHAVDDNIVTSDTRIMLGRGEIRALAGIQVNEQRETEPVAGGGDEPAIELKLTTVHLRLGYERTLSPPWSLSAGFQGFLQENESEGEEPFVPNAEAVQGGVFGLVRGRLGMLSVEGGLRLDVHSLETSDPVYEQPVPGDERVGLASGTFVLPSGSVGLTAQPAPGVAVKLNVGVGNSVPSLASLTANGALREIRRYLVGDPDLDAEHNVEMDLSATVRGGGLTVSAGGFANRIDRFTYQHATGTTLTRTIDGEPVDLPVFEYRQEGATLWGGQAEAFLQLPFIPAVRVFGRTDVVLARLEDGAHSHLPLIPAHHVLGGVEWNGAQMGPVREPRISFEADRTMKQDRVPSWDVPTPGYTLLGLSVTGVVPVGRTGLRVGVHALNLLDESYSSHLSLLRLDGIRDMGRNVTLTIHVPFGGA